jgi:protein SCO1
MKNETALQELQIEDCRLKNEDGVRVIHAFHKKSQAVLIIVLVLLASALAAGQGMGPPVVAPATPPPQILNNISIEQKLNGQVPLDLPFTDENGRAVKLGDYFGTKPVVLALVYYDCPMLCTEVLNGMVSAFSVLKFDIDKEYDVVTVSFDPREKPELAAAKKATYLRRYGRPGAEQGWHFLTGQQAAITALTQGVGFHYQWDTQTQQFAHATALMMLTPQGKIAQYYYGIEYPPKDLRLALVEASQNRIGNVVDELLLYCYHYDPEQGKYSATIMRVLRLMGVATMLCLGTLLFAMIRRNPRESQGAKQVK